MNELIGLLDPKSVGTSTAALLVVIIIIMQLRKMNRVDAGDQFVSTQYQGVIKMINEQYLSCIEQHKNCQKEVASLEHRVMQLEILAVMNDKKI